jgi:Transketolase, pyrimidine binding domain
MCSHQVCCGHARRKEPEATVRQLVQDVERGTFSHRHLMITDQKTGAKHCAIDSSALGQKPNLFTICNSSLSEFGVLGYELGYSLENPNSLVCWEAQFGDFSNGAQIIFDQFMSAGESKWLRQACARSMWCSVRRAAYVKATIASTLSLISPVVPHLQDAAAYPACLLKYRNLLHSERARCRTA